MVTKTIGKKCLLPSLLSSGALQHCLLLLTRRTLKLRLHPLTGEGRWFPWACVWRGLSLGTQGGSGAKAGCWGCIVPAVRCDMKAWEDMGPLGVVWKGASQAWDTVHTAGVIHGLRCSVSCAEIAKNKSVQGACLGANKRGCCLGSPGRAGRLHLQKAACAAEYLACQEVTLPVWAPQQVNMEEKEFQGLPAGGGRVCHSCILCPSRLLYRNKVPEPLLMDAVPCSSPAFPARFHAISLPLCCTSTRSCPQLSSPLGYGLLCWFASRSSIWGRCPPPGGHPFPPSASQPPACIYDGWLPALLSLAKPKLCVCLHCWACSCLSAGLGLTAASCHSLATHPCCSLSPSLPRTRRCAVTELSLFWWLSALL